MSNPNMSISKLDVDRLKKDPAYQAFTLLRTVFTVAPILFGLDKLKHHSYLVAGHDWSIYLAGWINDIVPGDAHAAMVIVGIIEIVAGVLVFLMPRYAAYVVALWLLGIIVSLLSIQDVPGGGIYGDIALRDFGLFVAAVALARLSVTYDRPQAPLN